MSLLISRSNCAAHAPKFSDNLSGRGQLTSGVGEDCLSLLLALMDLKSLQSNDPTAGFARVAPLTWPISAPGITRPPPLTPARIPRTFMLTHLHPRMSRASHCTRGETTGVRIHGPRVRPSIGWAKSSGGSRVTKPEMISLYERADRRAAVKVR